MKRRSSAEGWQGGQVLIWSEPERRNAPRPRARFDEGGKPPSPLRARKVLDHSQRASAGAVNEETPLARARGLMRAEKPLRPGALNAKRLYSAVVLPEAGLAKIILAEIKEARRRIKRLPWKWATRNRGHFI